MSKPPADPDFVCLSSKRQKTVRGYYCENVPPSGCRNLYVQVCLPHRVTIRRDSTVRLPENFYFPYRCVREVRKSLSVRKSLPDPTNRRHSKSARLHGLATERTLVFAKKRHSRDVLQNCSTSDIYPLNILYQQ